MTKKSVPFSIEVTGDGSVVDLKGITSFSAQGVVEVDVPEPAPPATAADVVVPFRKELEDARAAASSAVAAIDDNIARWKHAYDPGALTDEEKAHLRAAGVVDDATPQAK